MYLCNSCIVVEDAKRSKYFRTLEDTGRNIILAENVTEFHRMLELVHHKAPKRMPQRVVKAFVEIQNNRRKGYEDGVCVCVCVCGVCVCNLRRETIDHTFVNECGISPW